MRRFQNGDFGVEFSHMAVREVQESSGGGSGGGDKFAIFLAARGTFGDQVRSFSWLL